MEEYCIIVASYLVFALMIWFIVEPKSLLILCLVAAALIMTVGVLKYLKNSVQLERVQ